MLFKVVSIFVACLIIILWLKPELFKIVIDKDNQYPSGSKQAQFTALIVSTWVLVDASLRSAVTEWMFGMYMIAWAGAQFGSTWLKIKGQSNDAQSSYRTTTEVSTSGSLDSGTSNNSVDKGK